MNSAKANPLDNVSRQPLSRLRRRAAVLAAYLGYLSMISVWYVASVRESAGLFILVSVLAVVMLSGLVLLFTSWVWYAANSPDPSLDERQQRVRDRAYLHSYQLFAGAVTLAGIYAGIAWDNGWWLPSTWNQVQAAMWGLLLFAITLPAAVVAWTEPEPSNDL